MIIIKLQSLFCNRKYVGAINFMRWKDIKNINARIPIFIDKNHSENIRYYISEHHIFYSTCSVCLNTFCYSSSAAVNVKYFRKQMPFEVKNSPYVGHAYTCFLKFNHVFLILLNVGKSCDLRPPLLRFISVFRRQCLHQKLILRIYVDGYHCLWSPVE